MSIALKNVLKRLKKYKSYIVKLNENFAYHFTLCDIARPSLKRKKTLENGLIDKILLHSQRKNYYEGVLCIRCILKSSRILIVDFPK